MSVLGTGLDVIRALSENWDLIEDVIEVVKSGASKDSVRKAIRDLKVVLSDEAFYHEIGIDMGRTEFNSLEKQQSDWKLPTPATPK